MSCISMGEFMGILGSESAVFFVNVMAENTRFWSNFGQPLAAMTLTR